MFTVGQVRGKVGDIFTYHYGAVVSYVNQYEDGLHPIVTHKFSNVDEGALGLFQAGEGEATEAGR